MRPFPWALVGLFLSGLALAQTAKPLTPAQTIASFTLPEGFHASVFAGEPDLSQPISHTTDDRCRIWVAENFSYPHWSLEGHDRIVILDDPGRTGHFTTRTVFYDKLNYVTGMELGFGGVYVVSAPNLLFIPIKPDGSAGEPQVLLEGFGHQGVHNIVNGCVWGPDGWLWGGHGGTSSGIIGAPGAKEKTPFDGGVWRYHPTQKIFEVVMEGTTNPWGLDFDDFGQAFISNSVTPHLYHVIFGSHVERRKESPLSQYAYGRIASVADHLHWVGADWSKSRGGTAEQVAVGGGHAHCGLLCYQGDAFPAEYRGRLLMVNIHGARVLSDLPERKGSGYMAHHGPDFLTTSDKYFRGLHPKPAPDGSIYLSDWYDTGECHTLKPDQTNGRIYNIRYKDMPQAPKDLDLSKLSNAELVEMQLRPNEWYVRHARRILQERGGDGAARAALLAMLNDNPDITRKLRALWALHAVGGLDEALSLKLLGSSSEYLRAWSIQFMAEGRDVSAQGQAKLEEMAKDDPSPFVRLYLASACQRIPSQKAWPILERLSQHGDDVEDQNLPLMVWYGLANLVPGDPRRALALAENTKIPLLRQYIARRVASAR